jgi:hypothetical protein
MNEYISKPIRASILMEKAAIVVQKNTRTNRSRLIDLRYLREVSGRDYQYEKLVTTQFIDMLPADLLRMKEAFQRGDRQYRKIAHDLKTTISVMGLNAVMDVYLDEIEHGSDDEHRFQKNCKQLDEISKEAVAEATFFLYELENQK